MLLVSNFLDFIFKGNQSKTAEETEKKMNFFKFLKHNITKTSFILKKKCQKEVATSSSLLWPPWSQWTQPEYEKNIHTKTFQLISLKEKLVMSKDILLKEQFRFINSGSSVDQTDHIYLLFALNFIVNPLSNQLNEFRLKAEEYFDYLALKQNEKYMFFLCIDTEKLISFFDGILEKKNNFKLVTECIQSITTFSLEDFDAIDRINLLSSYSGNIRLGLAPWNSLLLPSEKELKNFSFNSYEKSSTLKRNDANNQIQLGFNITPNKPPKVLFPPPSIQSFTTTQEEDSSVEARIKAKMDELGSLGKPPNILIYTDSDEDQPIRFIIVVNLLQQCISREHYAMYHLKRSQVTSTPWIENTVMLILAADKVPRQGIAECFLAYFINGGLLFSLACNFDELFLRRSDVSKPNLKVLKLNYEDLKDIHVLGIDGGYINIEPSKDPNLSIVPLAKDLNNLPLIVKIHHATDKGTAIFSRVSFDRDPSNTSVDSDDFITLKRCNPARIAIFKNLLSMLSLNCNLSPPPPLTPLLLFSSSNEKIEEFLDIVDTEMKKDVYSNKGNKYQFFTSSQHIHLKTETTPTFSPIITDADNHPSEFNLNTYREILNTKVLGNVALYADVTTTTMTVMDNFMYLMPPHLGLVVIAGVQNAGLGRGGNVWLSPKGCGLFSLHIRFPLSSPLGHHLSCVQHLVALAIVLSVREKPGYEDINLRIKWPNDVYFGEGLKLGGVLVRSTILQDTIHINLGCGLNISNKDPTLCVNDLIKQYNSLKIRTPINSNIKNYDNNQKPLALFTVEEFVARLINQIERLIISFQQDDGESFFELYYKYWLHSNQVVTLNRVDGPRGLIIGLSRYGFLSVRLEDGSITEVHPDGNSFDMMKNLIAPKIRT